jgi:hypothetical protein
MKGTDLLDNAAIAELLAREAEQASGQVRQAFRRAARKAFLWGHETYDLLAAGKPLTELEGICPFLARRIQEWSENPLPMLPRRRLGSVKRRQARPLRSNWQARSVST